jgi:hypothetical protein
MITAMIIATMSAAQAHKNCSGLHFNLGSLVDTMLDLSGGWIQASQSISSTPWCVVTGG